MVSIFKQLHRMGFNLECETLFESIRQVVADSWSRKGKISGCLKNSTSVALKQCPYQANFERKGSSSVLKLR